MNAFISSSVRLLTLILSKRPQKPFPEADGSTGLESAGGRGEVFPMGRGFVSGFCIVEKIGLKDIFILYQQSATLRRTFWFFHLILW
jgi:hypothetical protein